MTRTPDLEIFSVWVAGEQVPGTEIGLTYISVKTPLGPLRMTAEEAETLGRSLIHAAQYDAMTEGGDS